MNKTQTYRHISVVCWIAVMKIQSGLVIKHLLKLIL